MVKVKIQKKPELLVSYASGLDNLHSSQRDHLSIHRVRLLERYGHEDQDVHAEQSSPEVEDDEELMDQLVSFNGQGTLADLVICPSYTLPKPDTVIYH